MENLDFLDAPQGVDDAAQPTPITDEEAQPRGPDGRFAPRDEAQPEPQPQPEPTQEPEPTAATPQVPSGFVPVGVVQELRNEIRALKQQPYEQPQPYIDPDTAQLIQASAMDVKLNLSEELAREKYGDQTVTEAQQWAMEKFQQSPAYQSEVLQQRNPYSYVIQQFKREQALQKLDPDKLDAFMAWQQQQATAPAPTPQSPPPPQSIASAPSAGGGGSAIPTGSGAAFDNTFTR